MNVYEYGIAAENDEWEGALRLIATTQLPIYAGLTKTIVDENGDSLNERAVSLGRVKGTHRSDEYQEEKDLRYCVLAMLYHLNRIIDFYVELLMEIMTYPLPKRKAA